MGDLSNFERGQIVGARLAGASATKTATTSLGVSRETASSEVMSAYADHGKTTSANRNSGRKSLDRKRSLYIEKGCFEKSQNYCSTGDSGTEYVFVLKTLFPQKLSDVSFTNPTRKVWLQTSDA
jgi:hypothetical protein